MRAFFDGAERAEHKLATGRRAYVHVIRGDIHVNGQALTSGDAAKLTDVSSCTLEGVSGAEVRLFDLP